MSPAKSAALRVTSGNPLATATAVLWSSMTSAVSRRACPGGPAVRRSGVRRDVLVDQDVKVVVADLLPVDRWRVAEHIYHRDGIDEAVAAQRTQRTNWAAAPRHDERLTVARGAQGAVAGVAEFALTDLLTHDPNCSAGCYAARLVSACRGAARVACARGAALA
jgi:hypothetical protein